MRDSILITAVFLTTAFLTTGRSAGAASPPGESMFPPVERILGAIHAPMPVGEDLRDSLGPKRDVAWLIHELQSSDPSRRESAVTAMGIRDNVAAIPWIGAALLRLNEAKEVRISAAVALGRIGEPRIRKFLEEALRDPDVEVRFAAVLALGNANPDGAVTILERALHSDPEWWTRYAAAVALGKTKRVFAVGGLERAAREDEMWQVRLQAARSLGEIGTERAASALIEPLGDPDSGVRAAAALALGDIGGPAALEGLRAALLKEPDVFQRSVLSTSIRKVLARP